MGSKTSLGVFFALIIGLSGLGIGIFSFLRINQIATQPQQLKIGLKVYVNVSYDESDLATHIINFENKSYDYHNDFNLATDVFTVPISGDYLIIGTVTISVLQDTEILLVSIYVNNVKKAEVISHASTNHPTSATVTDILSLSAGDEVTLREFFYASNVREIQSGQEATYLTIYKLD